MLRGLILAGAASLLAACGGGGGGSGGGLPGGPTPANEYEISLTADRVSLPANIAEVGPGIGIDSPYTTTLYVSARRKNTNDPIPGGEDVFGCNVIPTGLEYGALYYLDGDPEHEVEIEVPGGDPIKVPGAYRAVTLDSNAGGASFHFHAGSKAGTATITCAVTDPQSGKQVSTALQIAVGSSTGKASQVVANAASPEYLFVQNANGPSQLLIQAQILDEAGQQIPDPAPGVNNLYARIVPTPGAADDGALLRAGGRTGKSIVTRSTNGQAPFTLVSGGATGVVLVEILTDRFDNNVDNGMVEEVRTQFTVPVVLTVGGQMGIVTDTALPDAILGTSYATVLQASGGVPPYSWTLISGSRLPRGLSLSADGILSGTPLEAGIWRFAVRLTDSSTFAQSLVKEFALTVTAEGGPLAISTGDLPTASSGVFYAAGLNAEGGLPPYTWRSSALPAGLSIDGRTGIISGTPSVSGTFNIVVTATDLTGTAISKNLTLEIDGSTGSGGGDTTAPTVVFTIPASGSANVDRCSNIVVRFSEAIDPVTVTTVSMYVRQTGGAVFSMGSTASISATTFELRQIAGDFPVCYSPTTNYQLVLTSSIRDFSGNSLVETVIPFSTGGAVDETPPQVLFTIPSDGQIAVSPSAAVTVVFNEAMDPDSIAPGSFAVYRLLDGFGSPIEANLPLASEVLRESDRRFTIAPQDPTAPTTVPPSKFLEFRTYRVVLSTSPRDLSGNQICSSAGGDCGTPSEPVEGDDPSHVFEFRVGVAP